MPYFSIVRGFPCLPRPSTLSLLPFYPPPQLCGLLFHRVSRITRLLLPPPCCWLVTSSSSIETSCVAADTPTYLYLAHKSARVGVQPYGRPRIRAKSIHGLGARSGKRRYTRVCPMTRRFIATLPGRVDEPVSGQWWASKGDLLADPRVILHTPDPLRSWETNRTRGSLWR